MKKTNSKHFFSSIVMVAIFLVLSYSCGRNTKVSEENKNEQFSEQESTDDSEANEDRLFFDDSMEYFGLDENKWEGYFK
jgi:hypothetical protein